VPVVSVPAVAVPAVGVPLGSTAHASSQKYERLCIE
jgi:hypothetical protein